MTFFESLVKPAWMPPDWAFPVAWCSLWVLQLVAFGVLVVVEPATAMRRAAIVLVAAQFVTAVSWQAVVFGPGRLALSAWWLVGVLMLVVGATVTAALVRPIAGALLAPTIVWMTVATVLGFTLLRLNPGA